VAALVTLDRLLALPGAVDRQGSQQLRLQNRRAILFEIHVDPRPAGSLT
jgi:hypothetical protein